MADGVEVRGKHVRVYFRYQGELCRETIPGDASPASVANAERLVGIINYEIQAGTFSYARHFPNSPKVKSNTFGHFIDLWLDIKLNEMATSGFLAYQSKVKNHIRPMWGDRQADQIDHLDLQTWVQKTLMPKLHNKTVREILSIMRRIFTLYRTRNKSSHDPTEGITIRLPDADDPDPFERSEIDLILADDLNFQQEINLIRFMIWTGPRVSEAMSLAWEDVDLDAGTVKFRRSQVRSNYRVTKTRRSTREVRLMRPALEALRAQVRFTKGRPPVDVDITDRDNRTVKRQKLHFVFHKTTTAAAITDPHIGFLSFQEALREGTIKPTRCEGHPDLYVMRDVVEDGEQRLTYALISDSIAKAYAVYFLEDPIEGKPCFGIGYATDSQFRNQGLATEVVKASMEELYKGVSRHLHEPGFYIEAIVGTDNLASQKVAARTLNAKPEQITDEVSGLPALHYVMLIKK